MIVIYNYFRDYDPATGVYVESDPLGLDGGLNTYAYVESDPIGAIDPFGLGPLKIVKLCAKGYKVVRNVDFKRAVQALRRGEVVKASSHKEARKVARAASAGKTPIREGRHRPDWSDHYHANPRTGGKVIYSIAAGLTIANYVDECDDCIKDEVAEVADFFNPLSTPKDLIDIYDVVTSE